MEERPLPGRGHNFPPSNLEKEENIAQVGPYRYAGLRIAEPGQPTYHVRVGTYTTGLDERLTYLVRQLTLVEVPLLRLTPLIGWWLARALTRPVADILQTADHLRPTRLGDRLPVHGTRDELDRLSSTINRLLDQVAGHVDRQRQFVADAAHELRGPLAAMQSALEVATSRDRNVESYRKTIDDVLEECRHLGRLTNDLLLLAEGESEAQPGPSSDLDFSALVRQSGSMFAGVAEERGIRLDIDARSAVRVRGDARQLRQVCSNLLDNAIRFTPAGGRIALRVAGTAAKPGGVHGRRHRDRDRRAPATARVRPILSGRMRPATGVTLTGVAAWVLPSARRLSIGMGARSKSPAAAAPAASSLSGCRWRSRPRPSLCAPSTAATPTKAVRASPGVKVRR